MGYLTDHFEPKHVMGFFEDIAAIPHTSTNEAALRDYIIDVAQKHGHEYSVDKKGNLMVTVKATEGYGNVPPVLLQAHMDMVGVKVPESKHDFLKDPIELVINGSIVSANGTTLGADNAVGMVNMLALMVDAAVIHPMLELLFTVEEESGLIGIRYVDFSSIRSRMLINMDMGDQDTMGVSCAGSVVYRIMLPVTRCDAKNCTSRFDLHTHGLTGGHGGLSIGFGRASALVLTARMLRALAKEMELYIVSVDRPLSRSIASETDCVIAIPADCEARARAIVADCLARYRVEFGRTDPNMEIELAPAVDDGVMPMDAVSTQALCDMLSLLPFGVDKRALDDYGVVLSSNNTDGVATTADHVLFHGQTRGSVDDYRDELFERVCAVSRICGATVTVDDSYGGWPDKGENTFQKLCREVYFHQHGTEMKIERANSCAEPAFIVSAIPDMQGIGISPYSRGAHSTKEHMDASSFQPFWLLLTELLKEVCLRA